MTRIRVSARDRQAAAAADQQCRLCAGVCLTPSELPRFIDPRSARFCGAHGPSLN